MKTTTYACDWCKAATIEEQQIHKLAVDLLRVAPKPIPVVINADICDTCLAGLQAWIPSYTAEKGNAS